MPDKKKHKLKEYQKKLIMQLKNKRQSCFCD